MRVFTRFASRRPQTPAQASLEASLDDSAPQGAGRPCYEAGNSACRGEWRREAGSPARARLMSARERESGELPVPNLPPFGRKAGRGLFGVHGRAGYCVSDGGERGRAGSPLPAAARTECAPYHPTLTPYRAGSQRGRGSEAAASLSQPCRKAYLTSWVRLRRPSFSAMRTR